MKRYLITTADERTWKFDRPVLFLGEWCRKYARRNVWEKMDAVVAAPYGCGRDVRDRDHAIARAVEDELFPMLCEELNRVHDTSYGPRFWRILLGHWLIRYVNVIFNRYHTLAQCIDRYDVCETSALSSASYHLATSTSEGLNWGSNDDVWNSFLYRRVLDFLPHTDVWVDLVNVEEGYGFRLPEQARSESRRLRLRSRLIDGLESVTNAFVRDSDAFIINSYLPRRQEAMVQLRLGQVPKVWRTPPVSLPLIPSRALRDELIQRRANPNMPGFRRCAEEMLFELLPVCFLEGFADLRARTGTFPWPKRPRFVFTSNRGDTDEGFKCWTAIQAENGTPYYTGQHGNNYGTHRYMNPTNEEQVGDKFLTWGWKDGLPQHTPAFIFKTAGTTPPSTDPNGGVLLVGVTVEHRITPWDSYADFVVYFEDQKNFVNALAPHSRAALTIRLHGTYHRLNWSEELRWPDFDPALRLDTGSRPIRQAIADNRLVVHSYDSTGILEGLAWNIPTLAFWQNGFDHLRDSAKPWYQLLVDAGIVHFTPESAASKVNAIWDDVPGWWRSDEIQTARQQFCQRYALSSNQAAQDFTGLVRMSGLQLRADLQ